MEISWEIRISARRGFAQGLRFCGHRVLFLRLSGMAAGMNAAAAALERRGMGRALDSTPTRTLLEELKAANIPLPTVDELLELSKKLCGWLEWYRKAVLDENSTPTWYNLCTCSRRPLPDL